MPNSAAPILRAPEPGEFPETWGQELAGYSRAFLDALGALFSQEKGQKSLFYPQGYQPRGAAGQTTLRAVQMLLPALGIATMGLMPPTGGQVPEKRVEELSRRLGRMGPVGPAKPPRFTAGPQFTPPEKGTPAWEAYFQETPRVSPKGETRTPPGALSATEGKTEEDIMRRLSQFVRAQIRKVGVEPQYQKEVWGDALQTAVNALQQYFYTPGLSEKVAKRYQGYYAKRGKEMPESLDVLAAWLRPQVRRDIRRSAAMFSTAASVPEEDRLLSSMARKAISRWQSAPERAGDTPSVEFILRAMKRDFPNNKMVRELTPDRLSEVLNRSVEARPTELWAEPSGETRLVKQSLSEATEAPEMRVKTRELVSEEPDPLSRYIAAEESARPRGILEQLRAHFSEDDIRLLAEHLSGKSIRALAKDMGTTSQKLSVRLKPLVDKAAELGGGKITPKRRTGLGPYTPGE